MYTPNGLRRIVSVNNWRPGDTFRGEVAGDTIFVVRELCDPSMCSFPVSLYAHALRQSLIVPRGASSSEMWVCNSAPRITLHYIECRTNISFPANKLRVL
jgi:hypothetical protein